METVGPTVGASVSKNSILSVLAASVGILLYLAWAFRKVKRPFLYGSCAIVAMLHDVFVVLGVFAILGEIDRHGDRLALRHRAADGDRLLRP